MKTSESIGKIIPALLKAQRKIGAVTKGANNPFFKSKYADLPSVMEVCKAPMNEEGIVIIQTPSIVKNEITGEIYNIVETLLVHESGEFISGEMRLILNKEDMQNLGSAISYSKRYTLQSLAFIPNQDDDDGNKASGKKAPVKQNLKKGAPSFSKNDTGF